MNIIKVLLFPVSLLYGLITWVRNLFFDWGILPSKSFDHPVISLGNLSSGGTGKTPHIEYLVNLLKPHYKVATLSRGYKRKSKGYQIVRNGIDVNMTGDEPLQIFLKHPEVYVTVCESRKKGISNILNECSYNQVILLDDAFQHRYVKPGLNILLTDYHRIFTKNYLLPTGNLREFRSGASRADALIVTKTPSVFSPLDRKLILDDLSKYNIKSIYFSYIKYGPWVALSKCAKSKNMQKAKTIFLMTGIANPTPLAEHLKRDCLDLKIFNFADHHQFTEKEIKNLIHIFKETYGNNKAIVTTEKDSMRLRQPELVKLMEDLPVYYVPIEVELHPEDKTAFDTMTLDFVKRFPKRKKKPEKAKRGKNKHKKT